MSVLLPSINSMYRNSFFPLHFRWVLRIKHRECVVVHVILFWRSFYIVKYEMVVLVVLECLYDGSMIMHAQPFLSYLNLVTTSCFPFFSTVYNNGDTCVHVYDVMFITNEQDHRTCCRFWGRLHSSCLDFKSTSVSCWAWKEWLTTEVLFSRVCFLHLTSPFHQHEHEVKCAQSFYKKS